MHKIAGRMCVNQMVKQRQQSMHIHAQFCFPVHLFVNKSILLQFSLYFRLKICGFKIFNKPHWQILLRLMWVLKCRVQYSATTNWMKIHTSGKWFYKKNIFITINVLLSNASSLPYSFFLFSCHKNVLNLVECVRNRIQLVEYLGMNFRTEITKKNV